MPAQHLLSNTIRHYALVVVCFLAITSGSIAQNYFLYVNKDGHFSMPIPEVWKRAENISDNVWLVAIGPKDSTSTSGEGIRASIASYKREPIDDGKFWRNYKKNLRTKYAKYQGKGDGHLEGVHVDCAYTMFSYTNKNVHLKAIHYYFESKHGVYIFTASSRESDFAVNRDTFDYMALNFSFEVNYQRLLDQE